MLTRVLIDVHVSGLVRYLAIPQYTGRRTWRRHVKHLVLKAEMDILILVLVLDIGHSRKSRLIVWFDRVDQWFRYGRDITNPSE